MYELRYKSGAEKPDAKFWLYDDDGTPLDLSDVGYTFTFKIGKLGQAAVLTKTTGITGAAQTGEEPTGVPAVTIVWAVDDLKLSSGSWKWELIIRNTVKDRFFFGDFDILRIID